MTKTLDVYLHDSLTGKLHQDRHGRISFTYHPEWLSNEDATPLSYSLPLQEQTFEAKQCQGFFAGVLPEEENRKIISSILGISAQNDFTLLEQIGGECAGAVSFLPHQSTFPIQQSQYQELTNDKLHNILKELPTRPLMAGQKDIRLSLAGAQNKLAVYIKDGTIALPLHNSPSTHIIKPAIERFPDLVDNEAFCMSLAKQCGLPTALASAETIEDIDYLLTKRYDRINKDEQQIERIHQEDFCQALGYPPHIKYQSEGGPSLAQCFELIREASTTPALDLLTLLDTITFNFIIGNNDAHGKNFSFLYTPQRGSYTTRLAPLYDLVSTAHYPDLSPKMAMKIGKKHLPKEVRLEHWQQLWTQTGFSTSQAHRRTTQFAKKTLATLKKLPIENTTQLAIISFAQMRANMLLRLS